MDLFLKSSRLIKSRSVAQEFCDEGRVMVNGAMAKPSKEVKVGDKLSVRRRDRVTEYAVEFVPTQKQVSKEKAAELYKIISETELAED